MSNQADAHFAGWLICPVCKKETRHYTKDTHESPVAKIRRIWCEDCRVVHMQFKQVAENENNLKIIECFACKDEGARKFLVCYLRWDHMDYYLKTCCQACGLRCNGLKLVVGF